MNRRRAAHPVAVTLFCLAASSVGCGDTPLTSPTTVASTVSTPAGMAILSVSPTAGPTIGGDVVRLTGNGFQPGARVVIEGIDARVMNVNTTTINAQMPPHTEGVVDVVVMNPDGQVGTLKSAYRFAPFSVTGGPSRVSAGGELTVSFTGPAGRGCNGGGDWIAIYRVGDPDQTGASNGHSDLWYDHVCGATSGTWKLTAPVQPGEYEFRFMVGDSSAARSNPITVAAP